MFSHLFRPLHLRGVELKNRVGISAHFAGWWVDEGLPTDAFAAYIEERAKGGIGLFVVGATAVRWDGGPTWMQNLDDRAIPRFRLLVEAAHRHGTKLFAQLIHCGDRPLPGPAVIADAPRSDALPPPRRMPLPPLRTVEDLKALVRCFAEAARRAREGGADGIEIHSHESFFHAQMLSPLWNRRTDAYGGNLENRLRFLTETLAGIRDRAGEDFPVGVRLKADDMAVGGMGEAEYAEVLRLLEASGLVDYFSLTGGDGGMHHGPFPRPDGEWLDLVGRLKAGTNLPVMHAGRITTAEMAEDALATGKLDVALMTKTHIADPHFVRKVAEGRLDEIRYCTRCLQSCVGKMEAMTCIYNPVTSREATWATLAPAARRKRVVIVGAGPAGMEAAITAAGRGHEVIVLEKSEQVGGQVRYASRSPHRRLFGRIWEFYERAAGRGAFSVRYGVDAGRDAILALAPDALVIATGSRPRRATLPGEGPSPLTIHEALDGAADRAQRVVIVDREGFTRPVVVADALSAKGIEVVFLTPFLSVSPELNSMSREELHARLQIQGVTFHPGEDVGGWVGGGLLVRSVLTAETRRIRGVDAVVIAAGSEPVNKLALALDGHVPELHVIGDANHPKTVEEATYQGGRVGRLL